MRVFSWVASVNDLVSQVYVSFHNVKVFFKFGVLRVDFSRWRGRSCFSSRLSFAFFSFWLRPLRRWLGLNWRGSICRRIRECNASLLESLIDLREKWQDVFVFVESDGPFLDHHEDFLLNLITKLTGSKILPEEAVLLGLKAWQEHSWTLWSRLECGEGGCTYPCSSRLSRESAWWL